MEAVTVTVHDATKALGLGLTTVYALIGQGQLRAVKVGRRTLITTQSIRDFVANLEAA